MTGGPLSDINYAWLIAQAPQYRMEDLNAAARAIADAIDAKILADYAPKKTKSMLS